MLHLVTFCIECRGGSKTAGTSKMERFVITVSGWKPLTIITKRSILDDAAVLDPPLECIGVSFFFGIYRRIICLCNLSISWTVSLVNDHSLLLYRNTFVLIDILSFLNMWQSLSAALMQCSMFECYVRSKYLNILPIAVVVFVLLSFWLI